MSRWRQCKQREFIQRLRRLGFEGPYSGTRHRFMIYQNHRLAIPSNTVYSVPQLRMMIREIETILEQSLSADKWNNLE